MLDIGAIQVEVSELLGCEVDVLTPGGLACEMGRSGIEGSRACLMKASEPRLRDYLDHMLNVIGTIGRYVAGLDRASFRASEEKQDAHS